MKIYHNPRCRKSRETLALLEEKGEHPEVILYLDNPPTKKELKAILAKLKIPAEQLVRKSEKIYKETYKGKTMTEAQWITAMVTHPKLIERPIVLHKDKAVIGRPPTTVLELL